MTKKRQREKIELWLNSKNKKDLQLLNLIDDLKDRRQFTPIFRKAITMYMALECGDVSLLAEYFPALVDKIKSPASETNYADIKKQIDRLEKLLQDQGAVPINSIRESTIEQSLKPIEATDQPTQQPSIKINQAKSDKSSDSSKNFANLMFVLNN